jgi:hypothetical protein
MAEARRAQPVDLHHRALDEAREKRPLLVVVSIEQPALAKRGRLGGSVFASAGQLRKRPFGVAADEDRPRAELARERQRLPRQRPPRQIAANDDEVRRNAVELIQHRREGNGVPMHVGEDGDAAASLHRPGIVTTTRYSIVRW